MSTYGLMAHLMYGNKPNVLFVKRSVTMPSSNCIHNHLLDMYKNITSCYVM